MQLWRPPRKAAPTAPAPEPPSAQRLYLRALTLQLSNPKTLIFFVALLPQFVDAAQPTATQFLVLGVTSLVVEFCVLGLYGYAAGAAGDRLRTPTWQRRIDVVSGGFLIGAGLKLAIDAD